MAKIRYKEEYAEKVYKLCLLGATDTDIADFFGASPDTIKSWNKKYPKFGEDYRRGRTEADGEIAKSLYHKAKGFKQKVIKFATHGGEITDKYEYEEEIAPDTSAAIFWLKSRRPDLWNDKGADTESGEFSVTVKVVGDDN